MEINERLAIRIKSFGDATYQLNGVIGLLHDGSCESHDDFFCIAYRDSTIKRFELCYDLFWKIIKDYLYDIHGIEVASPKKTFQEAIKVGLIDLKQEDTLIEIADNRNILTHVYSQESAICISKLIPGYKELMDSVVGKISLEVGLKA